MYPRSLTSNIFTGSKDAIGLTALQLTSTSIPSSGGVTVKAGATNTGTVYVGTRSTITTNTNAATDGFELVAGESVYLPVDNTNRIYVIANATSQRVFWMAQ